MKGNEKRKKKRKEEQEKKTGSVRSQFRSNQSMESQYSYTDMNYFTFMILLGSCHDLSEFDGHWSNFQHNFLMKNLKYKEWGGEGEGRPVPG